MTKPKGIFSERHLRLRSETKIEDIFVRFGPVTSHDDASFCRYTVSGADGVITRDIGGVDDVQAVQLAMAMAGSDLDRIADGGRYTILKDASGKAGHGLPAITITPEKSASRK